MALSLTARSNAFNTSTGQVPTSGAGIWKTDDEPPGRFARRILSPSNRDVSRSHLQDGLLGDPGPDALRCFRICAIHQVSHSLSLGPPEASTRMPKGLLRMGDTGVEAVRAASSSLHPQLTTVAPQS